MKKIITLLFIGLISFSINAQEKKAVIKFKTKTIDYGTIEKGADGVRVFEFTNVGDAPLVISKVKSSCGCTIPKWPRKPIMPGGSGEIKVKYDTNRVYPFRKTITVIANTDEPTAISIKGTIIDPKSKEGGILEKKTKTTVDKK